jgi:hypothetical protein
VPTRKSIHVVDLLIDTRNPRLEDELLNQREAIQAVAEVQKEKLVKLAEDIVEHGINPSDSPIVIPAPEDQGRYIVLEGNRRLSALKALENPDILSGGVDEKLVRRFQKLNRRHQEDVIETIDCVVFEERTDADHWIELRHTGENEGAGIVRWGALESARFRQRRGERVYHLQALDFLEEHGELSEEKRQKVPISSLERILSNPDIRAKLGLEMKDKILYTRFDEDEVAKGLSYIVNDLATGRIRTGDIYYKEDRIDYVSKIDDENLPDTSAPTGDLRPLVASLEDREPAEDKDTSSQPGRSSKPSSKERKRLIPRGCILEIDPPRINDIYRELKGLHVEKYSNAVAVLYRVFLELSLDSYIDCKQLKVSEKARLCHKMREVGKDLNNRDEITGQQWKAVRRASQPDAFLAANITTLHQYVHNPYFAPAPIDLRAAWDNLAPFIKAIWSSNCR